MDKNNKDYFENETVGLDILINEIAISSMQRNFESIGMKRTWEIIESLVKPCMRSRYRQWFFKAGGTICQ